MKSLDADKIRQDFSIYQNNPDLIYLDSACMSLKPLQVLRKLSEYYEAYTACAGRSAHRLARRVGDEVLKARIEVQKLIGARRSEEIIFTRNTTEGLNIVANGLELKSGDEVIISDKEHNSNLIPWLKLAKQGVKTIVCKGNEDGTFNMDNFLDCFTERTKIVSMVWVSNVDGVENPTKEIIIEAHKRGVPVMLDGAQTVPSRKVDVKKLDVDYLSFSGHKMLGPTGTGVLYGKKDALKNLVPLIVGGETVKNSEYESYIPEDIPMRFEAGLQDYAGIIGLGEACRYLQSVGLERIRAHEILLNTRITEQLGGNEKIEIIGPKDPKLRSGIFSFNIKGMDPHHVSRIIDTSSSIMCRSGAHCVHSWFNAKGMKGSVRASMYIYNTVKDCDTFCREIQKIAKF